MHPWRDGFVGAAVGDGAAKDFHQVVSGLGGRDVTDQTDPVASRLNSKVSSRNVAVIDLVTDLSDGVIRPWSLVFLVLCAIFQPMD